MEHIVKLISEHPKRPLFIAIEGHSAAGKSTVAKRITELINEAKIIHMDDFYRVMPEDERFKLTPKEGYERYYDWQRLKRQVLEPLIAGQAGHYQRYDWLANDLGETVSVTPTGILMIEGCYSMRPELLPFYDLKFYVKTLKILRMQRQAQRADNSGAWLDKWDAAETYHFSTNRPHKVADLIIFGDEVAA